MFFDLFPFDFKINPVDFASVALWSLALYLALTQLSDWLIVQLVRWFDYAERSLYTSIEEYERTRPAREAQNTFYASLFSVVPFLFLGGGCHLLLQWALGDSWAFSSGMLAAIGCGIYELGRRTDEAE
jgi:hypothetical protein